MASLYTSRVDATSTAIERVDGEHGRATVPLQQLEQQSTSTLAFKPFFALVTDSDTGEQFHPSVHYVFSDDHEDTAGTGSDNPYLTTLVALRALDSFTRPDPHTQRARESAANEDDASFAAEENAEVRYVLVDLAAPLLGTIEPIPPSDITVRVQFATSLSPSWGVTGTSLRAAPSAGDGPEGDGFMLMVEGISAQQRKKVQRHQLPKSRRAILHDNSSSWTESENAMAIFEGARRSSGDIIEAIGSLWQGLEKGLCVLENIIGDEKDAVGYVESEAV